MPGQKKKRHFKLIKTYVKCMTNESEMRLTCILTRLNVLKMHLNAEKLQAFKPVALKLI